MKGWKISILLGVVVMAAGLNALVNRSPDTLPLLARARVFPILAANLHSCCSLADAWDVTSAVVWPGGANGSEGDYRKLKTQEHFSLYNTPRGDTWIPEVDRPSLPHMVNDEARGIYASSSVHVEPGDTVLDCGANVGVFARKALESGAGLVVAIEPAPDPLWCLRENLKEEIASGRVIVVAKGVWDKEETLPLRVEAGFSSLAGSVVGNGGAEVATISLTTIDRIVGDLQLQRVDFVKMDIEGAETEALRGARETIRRFRPKMAVTLEHNQNDIDTLPRELSHLCSECRISLGPCVPILGRIQPEMMFVR